MNSKAMVIALILPILLLIGVIIGVRQLNNPAVAVGTIDTPDASSQACTDLVNNLPKRVDGTRRSDILDPVPAGAAAWSSEITLRCGVSMPTQYTELSSIENIGDIQWLTVTDETPGSDLRTFYTVNTTPIVAVTTNEGKDPRKDLAKSLKTLAGQTHAVNPLPLSSLQATASADTQAYADKLPDTISTGGATYTKKNLDDTTIGYTAPGYEEIVIRLGVGMPESYQAGAQLQQINDVPWYQETTLGNGITSGQWYALGQKIGVAVSVPTAAGNATLVTLSNAFDSAFVR
ncbi:MAG: DUF3515 domain-containing protein [Corynebacterium sp.]|nr:DUF3515 domain-containing protein [Corynebacterium sp.]